MKLIITNKSELKFATKEGNLFGVTTNINEANLFYSFEEAEEIRISHPNRFTFQIRILSERGDFVYMLDEIEKIKKYIEVENGLDNPNHDKLRWLNEELIRMEDRIDTVDE